CIQAVLPQMRSQGRGTIINVISIAGRQTFPNWGAYCASKFGLMGLTKTLAQEERSHGIRVVALCPGSVDTPIWDSETVQANFDRSLMLRPEDVADAIVHAALLPAHVVVDEWVLMPNTGTF
ncbi:MAG: SDR family NAD(P)-dependent oxidoreductase, partial [Thermosynechococcaceae cyanobacterium]